MAQRSFIVVCALLPVVASATVVMQLSVEQMAQRAPAVVRGTVQASRAVAKADHSIWTMTSVRVSEQLKGASATSLDLLVKQPGGVFDGSGQRVSGAARFVPGEDVVLFLEPAPDEAGVFVVLGLAAGKVNLERTDGRTVAVRHLDGLTFVGNGSRRVEAVSNLDRLGDADAFLARVRLAVRGGGAQ